jgi:hypothetical protein
MVKTVSHGVGQAAKRLRCTLRCRYHPSSLAAPGPHHQCSEEMRKAGFLARCFFIDPFVLSQLVAGISYHSVAAPVAGSRISIPARSRPTLTPGHAVHEKPPVYF